MRTLAIDFGNTRGKAGVFDGASLLWFGVLPQDIEGFLDAWGPEGAMVSNVGQGRDALLEALGMRMPVHTFSSTLPLPIQNAYATPDTLGPDRLAAALGAWTLFPNQPTLVVDLGTCITYELVTADGVYRGGAISPGLRMRAKAMHSFTAKLPEVLDWEGDIPLVGNTTMSCLRSGAAHGIALELEGAIMAYKESFGIFNTVFCGGDAHFFERMVKAPIFASQEIVVIGLNAALRALLASDHL